jgi:hypothetical protein
MLTVTIKRTTRPVIFAILLNSATSPTYAQTISPDNPTGVANDFASAAILSRSANIDCQFTPPQGPIEARSFNKARQQDERSYEMIRELAEIATCLERRLQHATAVVDEIRGQSAEQRADLTNALAKINESLEAIGSTLNQRTPCPVDACTQAERNATVGDSDVLQSHKVHLEQQNAVLNALLSELSERPTADGLPIIHNHIVVPVPSLADTQDTSDRPHIDANTDVQSFFPAVHTSIQFGLGSVPDPRVPRHRRRYDNAIAAINQGMLRSGFVLDRFAFPWGKVLGSEVTATATDSKPGSPDAPRSGESLSIENDGRFGLMLFRRDVWREKPDQSSADEDDRPNVEIRALYLIAETATYGVQRAALRATLQKIEKQLGSTATSGAVQITLAHTPDCNSGARTATLFGPTFSGSLESIRQVLLEHVAEPIRPPQAIDSLCMVSASATVDTNSAVDTEAQLGSAGFVLDYHTLAIDDSEKLEFIENLRDQLGIPADKVAIVYEGTTFGIESCKSYLNSTAKPALCDGALNVPVPVNIADLRYGVRRKAAQRLADSQLPPTFNRFDSRLSLEEGAENGSEFPESQQSLLTAASTALELEQLIRLLKEKGCRLVVVVATDVRDRLFLIEQIHASIRNALFVDLGADRLLGHQDFLHATRGALTLASRPLVDAYSRGTATTVWSTDEQASLTAAITEWTPTTDAPRPRGERSLTPYVVSRTGLVSHTELTAEPLMRLIAVDFAIVSAIALSLLAFILIVKRRGSRLVAATRQLRPEFLVWLMLAVLTAAPLFLLTESVGVPLGIATVILCVRWWSRQTAFTWPGVLIWLAAVLLLTTGILEVGWYSNWRVSEAFSDDRLARTLWPVLQALSLSATGGLSYPLAQCVAIALLGCVVGIGWHVGRLMDRSDGALAEAGIGKYLSRIRLPLSNAGLTIVFGAAFVFVFEPLSFLLLDSHQVTIFGRLADFSAFVSLVSASLVEAALLACAFAATSRIDHMRNLVLDVLRTVHGFQPGRAASKDPLPLAWNAVDGERPNFVPTPAAAGLSSGGSLVWSLRASSDWPAELRAAITIAPFTSKGLTALYALFAVEIWVYQLCVAGVVVAAIASGAIVYLFPVSQATPLIVLNMIVLSITGLYSAYKTTQFEGDVVLSSILCNRSEKREWSIQLFAGVILPFVALAILIGIGQTPGVLDVGQGVVEALVRAIKPSG